MKRALVIVSMIFASSAWADSEIVDGIEWTWTSAGTLVRYESYYAYFSGVHWEYKPVVSYSTQGDVTIPSCLGGYPITSIGYRAFDSCSGITGITIPYSVTSISSLAFLGCSGLTRLVIPESVTSISDTAFSGCSRLTDITIPSVACSYSMSTLFPSAYFSLTNVVITGSVTDLVPDAFSGCVCLESITVPSSVTNIGERAFYGCKSLKNVELLGDVATVGEYAFYGCDGLADEDGFVILQGTLHYYAGDSSAVTIPVGVSSIGAHAFYGLEQLEEVSFSGEVNYIGDKAFFKCSNLGRISFANSLIVDKLPSPTRSGYQFMGWFTKEDGGEELVQGMEVSDGSTYYAHWRQKDDAEIELSIDSFDLAIPEEITVEDGAYNILMSYQYSWSGDDSQILATIYNANGDILDNALFTIWGIEKVGESYGGAGVYQISVGPKDCEQCSGSASRTVMVNKINYNEKYGDLHSTFYLQYRYMASDWSQDWSQSGDSGYCYDGATYSCDFRDVSASNVLEIAVADYYSGYDVRYPAVEVRSITPSWENTSAPADSYLIENDYISGSGAPGSIIFFKKAGYYEVVVSTPSYSWNDGSYAYGYVEASSITCYVYVWPASLDMLGMSVDSDLVYTGEEIKNEGNYSETSFFGNKVTLSLDEPTLLYVERPRSVTDAGTYELKISAWQDYESNNARPTETDYFDENWICIYPDNTVNYTGSRRLEFTVAPRPVCHEQMDIVLPVSLAYDGTGKTCAITITNDYNGVLLQEGVDYDVEYSNNVYPGTATVTITCKGNYTGTFSRTFEIVNADFGLVVDGENGGASGESGTIAGYQGVYDGEGHGLAVDVSAIGDVGVRYALSEDGPYVDSLLLTNVCDQTVWVELSALNYNSFTGFAQVVISPKSIEGCQIEVESPVVYDGHAMKTAVSVVDDDLENTLIEGLDYELEYSDNEVVGTAGVKVVGIGNYTDEVDRTFEIVKGTIIINGESTWQWIGADGFAFEGTSKSVAFASDGAVPNEVVEVEITGVTNAVHAGTYTAYANGTMTGFKTDDYYNYYYSTVLENVSCTWQIQPRSCDNCDASLGSGVMFHTGGGLEPDVAIVDRTFGVALDEGVDYSLEYEGNVNIGIAQVNISFSGDYSGSKTLTFRIVDAIENLPTVRITPASGVCGERVGVTLNYEGIEGLDKCVRYTLDGSEPTAESPIYSGRFQMELAGGVWIKAAAFAEDLRVSEVSASHIYPTIASVVLGEGSDQIVFSNDEERPWVMDDGMLDPCGKSTMRSSLDVDNNTESGLSAVVSGKGTLSFKWKTSCEADAWGSHFFDHAACVADEVEVEWLDGVTDWVSASVTFKSAGDHTVIWKYVKDDADDDVYPGKDCAWLCDVVWMQSVDPVIVVYGDEGATVEGDSETGYTIKPSEGNKEVVVTIPDGVEPSKVTVEVAATVETVTANGANIRVMKGEYDIAEHLDLEAVTQDGVINITSAQVKEEVVKETLDTEKGAEVDISDPESPELTTTETKPGLTYTLLEGATLEEMMSCTTGDSKVGDGTKWTPTITVKGGTSGFYTITVEK